MNCKIFVRKCMVVKMNKLVIDSVKINDVHSLNLPVKEFSSGLNIICGNNEAGKSSMMKFLKECLFNSKDMNGDIELTGKGVKYRIKVEGKKSKKSDRLKLLAPQDIAIEDFLAGINQNFYQRAFTINLDDINNLDEELFKLIQDHNALGLVKYKQKLQDEIAKYLTETTGKPNKALNDIVKGIKALDSQIRELSLKEEEYSSVVNQIRETDKNLLVLKEGLEKRKLALKMEESRKEYEQLEDDIKTVSLKVNSKLYTYKSEFYELTKKLELMLDYIAENKALLNSGTKSDIDKFVADIVTNYGVKINTSDIDSFDVSREFELRLRNLNDKRNAEELSVVSLQDKLKMLENYITTSKLEIAELTNSLEKLCVEDYDLHLNGVKELRAAISSISEFSESPNVPAFSLQSLVNIIAGLALVFYGVYLHNTSGIILSVVGIFLAAVVLPRLFAKKSSSAINVYQYVKTDVLPKFNFKGNFLETVPFLNNILTTEEAKLKEYELINRDILLKQKTLKSQEAEFNQIQSDLSSAISSLEKFSLEVEKMSAVGDVKLSLELFLDFINDLRSLRESLTKLQAEEARIKFLEAEIKSFITGIEEFLKKTSLDTGINQMLLAEKFKEIQELVEENDKCRHDLEVLEARKAELQLKLNAQEVCDYRLDCSIEELEIEYESSKERRGELNEIKRRLEDFEGLIDLRNRRNMEQNRLREIVKNIYQKKFVLNVIKSAEERQRAQEPNLLSAETLLAMITGGKYVSADFSTETITTSDGEIKTCDNLSRGTKEQVYLAFRLGYAQNYGADGSAYRLPLIIDDAFVNFDKTRLVNVLKALKEFAKTNQVLFFTCHKEYITSLIDKDVTIVDMD